MQSSSASSKVSAGEKRGRSLLEETAGLGREDMIELSNEIFTLRQLSEALQDLQQIRVQEAKLRNRIDSYLQQLSHVPSVQVTVETLEKKYRRILAKKDEEIAKAKEPKKKKQRKDSDSMDASQDEEAE